MGKPRGSNEPTLQGNARGGSGRSRLAGGRGRPNRNTTGAVAAAEDSRPFLVIPPIGSGRGRPAYIRGGGNWWLWPVRNLAGGRFAPWSDRP